MAPSHEDDQVVKLVPASGLDQHRIRRSQLTLGCARVRSSTSPATRDLSSLNSAKDTDCPIFFLYPTTIFHHIPSARGFLLITPRTPIDVHHLGKLPLPRTNPLLPAHHVPKEPLHKRPDHEIHSRSPNGAQARRPRQPP
jgi:hypothetical protein